MLFNLHFRLITILLFSLSAAKAGEVILNEFMASNGNALADEDGSYEDWIELHNPGNQAVNLAGWGLSDNPASPFQWRFPADTQIPAGGHLLVWASGKDRSPGETLPGVLREVWFNIPGNSITNLTSHPNYPHQPSTRDRLTAFLETPTDTADNYGQRLRGILTAPVSGNYRFWIASDDNSVLLLGTNETPASASVIARVDDWTSSRQWNKYASQQSVLIPLVAGNQYYFEALMKEGGGGDNLAIRWQLPDGSMEEPMPAHYLTSPTTGQIHTNFRLSSSGETLTLTHPDGSTVDQVPPVSTPRNISYGRLGDGASDWHYLAAATPGAPNSTSPVSLPPAVTIHPPRGFRSAPFTATLSASDPSATIRYTLDGSTPGPSSALYTGPIPISASTTLRASAGGPGMISLPPATTTWLFLDDVVLQSTSPPPGWPANGAVNGHAMEYGMRPQIVTSDAARLLQGLTSIPSLSLVTDLPNLFAPSTGVYSNSHNHDLECPVSVELIDPSGNPQAEFHIDAGLSLRGAFSRSTSNPKHSLRLFFRSDYGEKSLDFPLFGEDGTSSFEKIDLRTAQNYSWAFQNDNRNTFLREVFSRDSQRDMGMPHTRSRYYHLYLNGLYWGLYMTQERGDADWASSYLGGNSGEWDTIKTSQPGYVTQASDGNFQAFHALHEIAIVQGFRGIHADNYWRARGLNPDGSPNPAFPTYLDQDNLIQYMLIAHYVGDRDSPVSLFMSPNRPNNMYALFHRTRPAGFQWLRHDAEHSLGAYSGEGVQWDPTFIGENITAQNHFNPATLNWRLLEHPEYRIRFADLAHRHLHGNGALAPPVAKARVQKRMAQIDTAIIAESARWGRGRTRDATWLPACNEVLAYLDSRRDQLLTFYRNRGWFPSIDAPTPTVAGTKLLLHAPTGFYYLTDGSDPRLPGGAIHPQAQFAAAASAGPALSLIPRNATWRYHDSGSQPPDLNGLPWNDPDYPDAPWPAGPAILGFAGATPQNPVATQTKRWISGNSGPQVVTTYLRHEFHIDPAAPQLTSMALEILRDDGAMLYLNGVELHRENMSAGEILPSTEAATITGGADQTTWFTRSLSATHLLRPGRNVLAASVHQRGATSSDKYFGLSLVATPVPESLELPIHLARATRARAYHHGEWSALTDGSTLANLPEPITLHRWDFESASQFLQPSESIPGGAALQITPGPSSEILRNSAAQDFPTAHLRVNNPLGSTLTWALPTTGFGALSLQWETRRSGQGAGLQIVETTTDGQSWSPLATYPVLDAAPQTRAFDLSALPGAENNPLFAVRIRFGQGDGGLAGNNRFDHFTLRGIPHPDAPPAASLAFVSPPAAATSGAALPPVQVRLLDENGQPATSYHGPVQLSLLGPGSLAGTLSVQASYGSALFTGLTLTGTGSHQLTAAAEGLPLALSPTFQSLALTTLVLPQFLQGGLDASQENNERVPFAWQARIEGLLPHATYRFANRAVLASDSPTNDGAGNMIFLPPPPAPWIRSTSSPRFLPADLGSRHHTLTADASGSFTGWFLTEPTGNARFTPGNALHFRLLLNDGQAGESTHHILTTAETAQVLRFGSGPEEATAILGQAPAAARRIALLFGESSPASRPLAATPLEITGASIDTRYAPFYRTLVAPFQGHWGSLLPNTLPAGLQRIEIRTATADATLIHTRTHPPAGAFPTTSNPSGGLLHPIILDPPDDPPTTFNQWRNRHFSTAADRANDSLSGPAALDDAGMANLLRHALGAGPADPLAALLPRIGTTAPQPPTFLFRLDPAKTDLIWIVRGSADLADWSSILYDSRLSPPPADPQDGWYALEVPADLRFFRLEVQLLPH